MTNEERMIRVDEATLQFLNSLILTNQELVGQDIFPPKTFSWKYLFESLELAPPEGFEPKCKRESELWRNTFEGYPSCSEMACLSWYDCPYRKRE